jgi:hypothetical protein
MPTPASLLRMTNEVIFVLLGGLLMWIGMSHRFLFDPRKPGWLGLGVILVYWGARAWIKTRNAAPAAERLAVQVGGASLAIVGVMMLSLIFVEWRWAGPVLALAGGILVLRGLFSIGLSLRMD